MKRCLMLDLKDDPDGIARYEELHREIWPEVASHLREQGVTDMLIFRLGTRLCMLMETDDQRYEAQRMAHAEAANPRIAEWEALMWQFQSPTPWTPKGRKWTEALCIFDLGKRELGQSLSGAA